MLTQTFIIDFEELRDLAVVYERYLAEMRFPLMVDAQLALGERVRLRVNLPDGSGVNITGKVVGSGPDGEGYILTLPSNEDTRWLVGKAVELTVRIRRMMATAPYSGPDRRGHREPEMPQPESAAALRYSAPAPQEYAPVHNQAEPWPVEQQAVAHAPAGPSAPAYHAPMPPRYSHIEDSTQPPTAPASPLSRGFVGYEVPSPSDSDPNMQNWVPPQEPSAEESHASNAQAASLEELHQQLAAIRARDLEAELDAEAQRLKTSVGTPLDGSDHLSPELELLEPDPAEVQRPSPVDSAQRWPTDAYPSVSAVEAQFDDVPLVRESAQPESDAPAVAVAEVDGQGASPRFPVDEYMEPVAVEWEEQEGRTLAASAEELKLDVDKLLVPSAPDSVEARISALAMGSDDGWEVAEGEELQLDDRALPADTLYEPSATRTYADMGQTLKERTALFTDPNLVAPPEDEPFAEQPGRTALFTDPNLVAPPEDEPFAEQPGRTTLFTDPNLVAPAEAAGFEEQPARTALLTDMSVLAHHDNGPFQTGEALSPPAVAAPKDESAIPFSVQRTLELCLDPMTPLDQIPKILAQLSTDDLVILLRTKRLRPLIAGFAQRLLDERQLGS